MRMFFDFCLMMFLFYILGPEIVLQGHFHHMNCNLVQLGCDIEGAQELGVIYFPTNWGAI